ARREYPGLRGIDRGTRSGAQNRGEARPVGLAQLQSAVARLCGDAGLRTGLLRQPQQFAARLGLSAEEAVTLAKRCSASIDEFAMSLRSKRFQDVAKVLPMTVRALGAHAGRRFHNWMTDDPRLFTSIRDDAIHFARFVQSAGDVSAPVRALAT